MNNLPCIQIRVDLPDDGLSLAFINFDELKKVVCADEGVIKRYAKTHLETPIDEEFENFLNYWFMNGLSGTANFYMAKMKIEPKEN